MTKQDDAAIQSGALKVEETEHMAAGLSEPRDISAKEVAEEDGSGAPLKTALGEMTLSMFVQGGSVRVRVGNAHNASELYEGVFDSADEANSAMLDAGILTASQVPDVAEPAGTGIALVGITVQQLEEAGLKRHGVQTG